MNHSNLHSPIPDKLLEQDRNGGIYVSQLQAGSTIIVSTRNSTYTIVTSGSDKILIQGGRRFPDATEVLFQGSTWGSHMIKADWIGFNMHMELMMNEKVLLTSSVKAAKIIAPEAKWEYALEWG